MKPFFFLLIILLASCSTPNMSGNWSASNNIYIDQKENGELAVTINNRGPFKGVITGNIITVDFYDDPGCCKGIIEKDVIRWSNGSVWRYFK